MSNATIERIRAEEAARETTKRLTKGEVTAVVDGLTACRQLDQVAAEANLDADEVLSVVAEFGTWLTHVRGGAKVDTIEWWETGRLFPINDADDKVVIPAGFGKASDHGRDVAKSLAAIVVCKPSEEEVSRWLARKYPSDTAVLTFPMVSSVWKFDQLGKLDSIDEVSPHSVFRRLVVEAFDLLHVAVVDAQQAARTIARLSQADSAEVANSVTELRDAATKLSWLQPREMGNLAKLADLVASEPSAASTLTARVRTIGRLMAAEPRAWFVESIGQLNQGHVEQIARRAGLSVEGVSRAEESAIRQRLASLGLKADADRLVPEGVRALISGVDDAFWEAMELRAGGDASWRTVLADAYAD